MRERPINLDKYGIDKWEYRELMAFCRQYPRKKREAQNLLGVSSPDMSGMPKGNKIGNPTEAAALKRLKYLNDIELIECSAMETQNGIWYEALIQNCCYGVAYNRMSPAILASSMRTAYFKARREFFWRLYHMKLRTAGDILS